MLYKLALEVQTIFLNQTTWYLVIHLTTANMKCSGPLSAPALFQASVRQPRTMFWRFEISQSLSCFVLVNHDHMSEWQPTEMAWQTYQSGDDLLLVSWNNLEDAKLLFQILSSLINEDDCRLACEDFNLCTNYTVLGPENPLRWANKKISHPKVCILHAWLTVTEIILWYVASEIIRMIWCFVMLYDDDGNDETSGLSVSSSPPVKKSSPTAMTATPESLRARLKCLPFRWGWWWWWWLNDDVGDHSHPHLHQHPPPYPCFDKT